MVIEIIKLIKKHKIVFFIAGITVFVAFFVALSGVGLYTLENNNNDDCTSYDSSGKTIKGSGGDWTKKGTWGYKAAKTIFDYFVSKGFSGAAAAGVVGNAYAESNFNPTISAGNGDGGWGVFQFTPPSTHLPHFDWRHHHTVKDQCEAIWTDYQGANTPAGGLKHAPFIKKYANETSPTKAARDFCINVEEGNLAATSAYYGQTIRGHVRDDAAKTAYELFGGSKIKAKNSLLGGAGKGATTSASTGDSDCDNDGDGGEVHGDIAKTALKYLGWFHYGRKPSDFTTNNPSKSAVTDCSGFVWFVLKKAGYKIPTQMWYTLPMETDAKGPHKYLKQISAKNSRAGDIIIVNVGDGSGDKGHTAILLEKFHGNNTKLIQQGNGDHVNKGTYLTSFYSLIQRHGRVTIARAIKKK